MKKFLIPAVLLALSACSSTPDATTSSVGPPPITVTAPVTPSQPTTPAVPVTPPASPPVETDPVETSNTSNSSTTTGTTEPPTTPIPTPRPGKRVFNANFNGPTIGIGGSINTGVVPPTYSNEAVGPNPCTWAVNEVDFQYPVCDNTWATGAATPNTQQSTYIKLSNGTLVVLPWVTFWDMFTTQLFNNKYVISVEAEFTCSFPDGNTTGCCGPLIYNGDGGGDDTQGNFYGAYLQDSQNADHDLLLFAGGPKTGLVLPGTDGVVPGLYKQNVPVAVRIDYDPNANTASVFVNGILVQVWTQDMMDPTNKTLANPGSFGLFFGNMNMTVTRADVYSTDPNAVEV